MADEYSEMCEYPFCIRGKIARMEGNFREALIWSVGPILITCMTISNIRNFFPRIFLRSLLLFKTPNFD